MSDASGSMFPPEWGAMPNDDAPAAERGAYPNNPIFGKPQAAQTSESDAPSLPCQFEGATALARAANRLYGICTRPQLHLS